MSSSDDRFSLTTSPTIGAIAAAMAKAQLDMGPAAKDAQNPHFRSSYASLASCVEACKPLHANGIAVFQPPVPAGPDGVAVATLLAHSSGEWIRGELYLPAAKRDPQGFGSALTYARRYCLCATVGLASDDDDGESASRAKPGPAKPAAPSRPASDLKLFSDLCDRIDAAESDAMLNGIAKDAQAAQRNGALTEDQMGTIKKGVTSKRSVLQPANGAS